MAPAVPSPAQAPLLPDLAPPPSVPAAQPGSLPSSAPPAPPKPRFKVKLGQGATAAPLKVNLPKGVGRTKPEGSGRVPPGSMPSQGLQQEAPQQRKATAGDGPRAASAPSASRPSSGPPKQASPGMPYRLTIYARVRACALGCSSSWVYMMARPVRITSIAEYQCPGAACKV